MQSNNAVKKPQIGSGPVKSSGQSINLKNQQIDVARLKPEAKSRLIEILSSRFEKNTSNIHIKDNQAVDRTTSDFNDLVSLIRTEINPQSMSEVGKEKLIYLLHSKVEQQDKVISSKGTLDQSGTPLSLGGRAVKSVRTGQPVQNKDNKITTNPARNSQARASKPALPDLNLGLDYRQDKLAPSANVSAKRPLKSLPEKALNTAKINKSIENKQSIEKKVSARQTRQPIDLTATHGQDERMPAEELTLIQRISNSIKALTGLIKLPKKAEVTDRAPDSLPKNLPKKGMPEFNGVEDDEEDEEDDEVDNETLFELKDHFTQHSQKAWPTEASNRVIEVLHLNKGEVIDVTYLEKGQSYKINQAGKSLTLARHKGNDKCQYVFNGDKFKGEIRNRAPGGKLSVNELTNQGAGVFSGNSVQAEIPSDSDVCMRNGQDTYIVRASFAIKVPRVKEEVKDYKTIYQSIAGSTGFHLLVLAIAAIVVNVTAVEPKEKEPDFVKIELPKELPKIEKPKPKPKVEKPKPKAKPKPKPKPKAKVKPKPKPKAKPKTKAKAKPKPKAKPKAGGGAKGNIKKRDVKKSGLLAALGTSSGKTKPKRSLANITSLDAVSSSSSSARLKVSGLKAKVGSSRMTLPTGELITSKGAADVLRSGGVGGKGSVAALSRGGTGTQAVAGRVTASMSKRVKIKGGLSRDQVKRVIDANMDDVTYCYETSLMNTPSLAGKAVFEWKVLASGKVGAVNIKSSTVRSDEIHSCIKSAIKTWKFPQPSGGDAVFVSYPFIFDTVGF